MNRYDESIFDGDTSLAIFTRNAVAKGYDKEPESVADEKDSGSIHLEENLGRLA